MRHKVHQVALAFLHVALIYHGKVGALVPIYHHALRGDVERLANALLNLAVRRSGNRQNLRRPQRCNRFSQPCVERAEARFRGAHMMGLVNHRKADGARCREFGGMECEILRRGEHDVYLVRCKAGHNRRTLFGR